MKLPRFSLRLLLLVVTAICAWLAWERHVVVQRRAALEAWESEPEVIVVTEGRLAWDFQVPPPRASVSRIRGWLGDEALQEIWFPADSTEAEVELAARLFPEAQVTRLTLDLFGPLPNLPDPR